MYYYFFLMIAIVFALSFYLFVRRRVVFLNRRELRQIIINDTDNYYSQFSKSDLKARHVKSPEEYKNTIEDSPTEIDIWKQMKLFLNLMLIDVKLASKITKYANQFDVKAFIKIPWKIGFIKDNKYEDGLPHTRNDTIILPDNIITSYTSFQLRHLLIHEKIHLYQKIHPQKTKKYLTGKGFVKVTTIKKSKYNIRAKPDIDPYIYKNQSGKFLMAQFNSPNPSNIGDVNYTIENSQKNEHPYEYMAIQLSKECA